MTQRPFNMHVGIYTKTLCDDLRKCLLITLTFLFVCPGVWGQSDVIEVSTKGNFGSCVNWRYNLENGKTYKLMADINTEREALYIYEGRNVTIDLNGHTLNGGYQYSSSYLGHPLIKNDGTLTIKGTGTIAYGYGDPSGGIANNGELTLENVTVTGNKSGNLNGGGGIYNNGTLYIKGNTTVTGNTFSGTSVSNIYLPESKVIHIADNITGAANGIGITMATRGTFTSGLNGHGASNQFSSDVAGLEIATTEGGEAKIITVWEVLQQQLNTEGESSGTVTLDQDYTAISGDIPLEISGTVTLDLNGHTIDRGLGSSSATANGEVINITSGGNLTITGTGTITGGNVSGNGGAIINAGTLDIQGGTITGNSATGNGGAVFNTGTATISGGTLSSNSASQGGVVYNNGTLAVSSCTIQNNTASTNGGGIYHYDGTLNMSGAPTISGNQKSSTANNIYLASGKQITINGDLSNTTPIGVTMADGVGVFTTGLNSHTGDYNKFESDDNRFQTADATGEAKLWTFWAKLNNQLDAGGTINLDRNYVPIAGYDDTYLSVNSDITLNLNTYTINRSLATAIVDGYVIKVASGHTLTIAGTGTITGGNNTGNGGGILNEGTLVLSGGSITGNIAATGGGIYNGGTLQMSGAPTVKNNTGGNIYLPDGHATITLNGTLNGTDGNIGITMQTPGTFTSGLNTYGTIAKFASDNSTYIVALSANEATLMTPWAALKAAFAAGGDINLTRNYTAPANDYLTVDDSKTVTLDLKGHTIDRGLSDAAAVANGYVIKVNTGSTLTIKDTGSNGRIIGGKVLGGGGAITNAGTLNIQGGTITGNSATGNGGAVYNTGTTTISGGSLTGNSAVNGGAIYNSGTLIVSGGSIQNNTATTNGGAIYHNGPSFSLQGSPTITSNTVSSTANNVYLATTKQITISGGLSYSNDKAIGIATEDARLVFTTGLSGNGNASKFTSNQAGKGIGLNSAGEAIFGTSYTINRNINDNSLYLFIKDNWYYTNTAVEGEYVRVRLEANNSGYIPISLYYTDGTLSSYPEYSTEYTFTMPDHEVTITGLGKPGGYCGATTQKNIKYYLDGTTLRFVAKDASDYQMANYVQTTVPWSSYDYSAVDIPNNVTNIGDYAFFGSNLETIAIPSTVTSIGTFAFANCQSLTNLTVNGGTSFEAEGNVLYNYGKTNLICYPAGIGTPTETQTYTLPSTVTEITNGAFAYNTHLTAIEVAAGSPFTAPNGVLYKDNVLYCYPARKTGYVYDVASTVIEIKPYAFHNNNLLKAVNFCEASVPTGGEAMFNLTDFKIMVKNGLKVGNDASHYQGATNWSNYYSRIYEMDLANAIINLEYDNYVYETFDNPVVKPGVTSVKLTTGDYTQTLRSGIDYEAIGDGSYSNNNVVGTATVTITSAGGYDGTSSTKIFTIKRQLIISGASDYYSYYAKENLFAPEGIGTVYTVSGVNWSTGVVTVTNSGLGYLPENVPVLIYKHTYASGTMNGTYQLTAHAAGTPPTPCEYFKAETEDKTLDGLKALRSASEIYVLRGNNFVRATSGTLKARHCYLWKPIGGGGAGAPAQLSIIFDDNTTNIDLQADSTNDSITNSNWYTLDGRKLEGKPAKKGVYIKNGKKVVVK